jgi:hypothetical protein
VSQKREREVRRKARLAAQQEVDAARTAEDELSRLARASFGRKLARAELHTEAVDAAFAAWRRNGYRTFENTDDKGITTAYAQLVRPLPEEVPLLIGDAAQCLLNSLDHLAFAVASANNPDGLTQAQEEASQFPIQRRCPRNDKGIVTPHSGIATWAACAQTVGGVMQPYLSQHGLNAHPLWLLRDLANRDKHRALTVTAFGHSINEFSMGNGYIDYFKVFRAAEIGTEPVALLAYSRRNYGDIRLRTSFEMRFAPGPLVAGREVVGTLRTLAGYIRTVPIPRLAKYL